MNTVECVKLHDLFFSQDQSKISPPLKKESTDT